MTRFIVYSKETGAEVHRYTAEAPVPWKFMEFETHDHVPQPDEPDTTPTPGGEPWDWLLDVGAFFDRFGDLRLTVLASTHPLVQAVIKDAENRKWIDLTRADVRTGLRLIASVIPELTEDMIDQIATMPVRPNENLALRIDYFNGENNG